MQYVVLLCKREEFNMRFLEELSINAFPSLQTVLYDGWILRFADGYGNRPNSVNPIYTSTENVHDKIKVCESIYKSKGLKPVYKITPFCIPDNLDQLLETRGYNIVHCTSVQTMALDKVPEPTLGFIKTYDDLNEGWLNIKHPDKLERVTYEKIQKNIIPMKFYVALYVNGEAVATGMTVIEREYAGLFDIFVNENFRNKGYGKQLILHLLHIVRKHGGKMAYLQVMKENMPAVRLYKNIGFKEEYQYWYRVKDK